MTTVRRIEHPYNTNEQVRGYLEDALAIVSELGIDGDLKVAAFERAVDLLAAKHVAMEQLAPGLGAMTIPRGR